MAPLFVARPDQRCQRGLHVLYQLARPVDERALAQALQSEHAGKLVESEERWGHRIVRRLVLQFRFEVRLGARDSELSFFHRAAASPDARAIHVATFERILRAQMSEVTP